MPLLIERQRLSSAISLLPTFALAADLEEETVALIIEILEEFYTDGISELVSAQLDGEAITGEFLDRVGLRAIKRFRYRITEDEIEYGLLNPEAVEGFSLEEADLEVFAAKKKAKSKKKKPNCKKGLSCGNTCISAKKTCRKKPNAQAKKKIAQAKAQLGGSSAGDAKLGGSSAGDAKSDKKAIAPELHEFYDFVKSKDPKLSSQESAEVTDLLGDFSNKEGMLKKIASLKEAGMEPAEAAAFAGYIGASYGGMNQVLYDSGRYKEGNNFNENFFNFDEQMVINKAAASGLAKLPSARQNEMKGYNPGDPLIRHETIPSSILEKYIDRHKAHIASGTPIIKEQFMSTSWNQKGIDAFSEEANVEFRIKGRLDGTGQGKLVDQYKNVVVEDEVLYPPFTKFKVSKITREAAIPAVTKEIEIPKTVKAQAQKTVAEAMKNIMTTALVTNNKDIKKLLINDLEIQLKIAPISQKAVINDLISNVKGANKLSQNQVNQLVKNLEESVKKAGTKKKKIELVPEIPGVYVIEMEELL